MGDGSRTVGAGDDVLELLARGGSSWFFVSVSDFFVKERMGTFEMHLVIVQWTKKKKKTERSRFDVANVFQSITMPSPNHGLAWRTFVSVGNRALVDNQRAAAVADALAGWMRGASNTASGTYSYCSDAESRKANRST